MEEKIKGSSPYRKLAFLLFILIILVLVSFRLGRYPISLSVLFKASRGLLSGNTEDLPREVIIIMTKIRIPRILGAILIGASLALSGSSYQALFQNPMVSPDILGASQGAGLGAALGILMSLGYFKTTLISFFFGILSVAISYLISSRFKIDRTLGLVLSGMMVSSVFSSLVSFVKLVADPDDTLPAITYWLMGSLASIRMVDIGLILFPIGLGILISLSLRWKMNLLTMGEDEARSMGINTSLLRVIIIFSSTLMTAACVSVSGMIGWVGLVIPHFARIYVGNDYRYLMPASALIGSSFLLLVDNIARNLATSEIPLGILTSFVGAPMFLYLILKRGYN